MATLWGGAIGALTSRWSFRGASAGRLVLALAGPIGAALVSLARFYTSPMIFAYDPFVGYFSGTLYDTVLELDGLRSYRIGSAFTFLATCVAISAFERMDGRIRLRTAKAGGRLAVAAACALASLTHASAGPSLGHWQTRESITETLGGRMAGTRCLVLHARSIPHDSMVRMLDDCEAHLDEVEDWLGVRGPEVVTIFVFEDEAQKARLMGAAGTNIAKPWRAEVYVHDHRYPNPVLGHELAHVVAASIGAGPFRIAGRLGGLLPNPGLIEGLAVAASPRDDDLSGREWSRAMLELGILPRLERLFALGFLGENSSTAYTVSGAFVEWVRQRHGNAALHAWYGGADLPTLVGSSWDGLEQQWRAELSLVDLPVNALEQARAKFERPGFFARRCPRLVDACRERADEALSNRDVTAALFELETARRFEPDNGPLAIEYAEALVAAGAPDQARRIAEELGSNERLASPVRDRGRLIEADLAVARGAFAEAEASYRAISSRAFDETRARAVELRLEVLHDAELRPVTFELQSSLVASSRASRLGALVRLAALSEQRPDEPNAPYLLGRNLLELGDFELARHYLEAAIDRGLTAPRLRAEALRNLVVASCALREPEVAAAWLAYAELGRATRPARIESLRGVVRRCSSSGDAQ
jgi:hypothetical protein